MAPYLADNISVGDKSNSFLGDINTQSQQNRNSYPILHYYGAPENLLKKAKQNKSERVSTNERTGLSLHWHSQAIHKMIT